jgi:hypothetical protein
MIYDINRNKQRAIDWIQAVYNPPKISPLARDVIGIIDKIWGIHNFGKNNLDIAEWGNNYWFCVRCDRTLSTVDNSDLTSLVVLLISCSDNMLRMEISPRSNKYLELVFHRRQSRDYKDGFHQWCPKFEDHVKMILNNGKAKGGTNE